ncbi:MAG: gas vesicle protein GvpG [Bacillota bacterium]
MLGKLLLLPLVGPIEGLIAIARKVQELADKELNDPEDIKKRLAGLQMNLELGRITEEEYLLEEAELLEKLEQIELNKEGD